MRDKLFNNAHVLNIAGYTNAEQTSVGTPMAFNQPAS